MKRKIVSIILLISVISLLSGCFNKKEQVDSIGVTSDSIEFAKGLSETSFSSSDYESLKSYVELHRDKISDEAFEERLDFTDVAVMNMFRDEGAVQDFEMIETFVESSKDAVTDNVVVVSKVNYTYVNFDEDESHHDHEHGEDFHDHSTAVIPRTVVDVYRFKDNVLVEFERF